MQSSQFYRWIHSTHPESIHFTYKFAIILIAVFVAGSAMISLGDYYASDRYRERRASEEEVGLLRKLVGHNKKR